MFVRTMIGLALAVSAAPALALEIFACEPEWGALALELGGEDVDVYTATTALQDVHRIQARPSLIAKYRQAELVVCTGAELEIGWLPALAEKGNNPRVAPGTAGYFEASSAVRMLDVPSSVDRSMGDVHPYGNPHIQTSPRNIERVAAALAERLAQVDAPRAAAYRERAVAFDAKWAAAMQRWDAQRAPLQGVAAVSAHKSWAYLYDWLGMKEVAALEPKPGIPPSAGHLEKILAGLARAPAKMVIRAAYQDPRPTHWLAGRAQIAAVELPFTVGGAEGAGDLVGLFDVTLARLLQAAGATP